MRLLLLAACISACFSPVLTTYEDTASATPETSCLGSMRGQITESLCLHVYMSLHVLTITKKCSISLTRSPKDPGMLKVSHQFSKTDLKKSGNMFRDLPKHANFWFLVKG